MFNIIEIVFFASNSNEFDVPGGIDLINVTGNIFYAFYRIMLKDQSNGICIIGIDPEGFFSASLQLSCGALSLKVFK